MVHWPTASNETVDPETLHTDVVVETKDTVRPELALADGVKDPLPMALFVRELNVMIFAPRVTAKLLVTVGAAW